MAKDCAGMELNGQFFEIAEKFCYIGDTKGALKSTADSVIKRIRSGYSKFRDLVAFLVSRGFPLKAKGRLYSVYVCSLMLYDSDT